MIAGGAGFVARQEDEGNVLAVHGRHPLRTVVGHPEDGRGRGPDRVAHIHRLAVLVGAQIHDAPLEASAVLARKQAQVIGVGQEAIPAPALRLFAGSQLPGHVEGPLNRVQQNLQDDHGQVARIGRHDGSLTELGEVLLGEAPAVLDVEYPGHGQLLVRGGEHAMDEVALKATALDDALHSVDG